MATTNSPTAAASGSKRKADELAGALDADMTPGGAPDDDDVFGESAFGQTAEDPAVDEDDDTVGDDELTEGDRGQNVYNVDADDVTHMPMPAEYARGYRRRRPFGCATTRMMVIVDVTGVHEIPVVFCRCARADPEDIQLLRMGLYPATPRRPKTAFTFKVLDDALLTNKECKTSLMNYYNRLRRLTDEAFPHSVPVCSHTDTVVNGPNMEDRTATVTCCGCLVSGAT